MTATLTCFPPAQLAVISGAALGRSNAEIAAGLGLTLAQVGKRMHQAGVMVGVGTRHGLVGRACRFGQLQDLPVQGEGPFELTALGVALLGCYGAGLTYRQTARALRVSAGAVQFHTRQMRAVLGAGDRAHAVLIAWQMRVLPDTVALAVPVAGAGLPSGGLGGADWTRAASVPSAAPQCPSRAGVR